MAFWFGLWCLPVITIFPTTAIWLLGISTLLWAMVIFLEQIILTVQRPLSQRAEFYMMLSFIGIVVSIMALATVHQQPWIFWFGAAAIFSLYLIIKLMLIAKYKRVGREV